MPEISQRSAEDPPAPFPYPVTASLIVFIAAIYTVTAWPTMERSASDILDWGGLSRTGVEQGQYWRLLTANFLHVDFYHLLSNGFAIYIFGHFLETMIGSRRLLLLMGLSILGTDAMSLAFATGNSVGSSGIAYGLMFHYFVLILFVYRRVQPQLFASQLRSAIFVALLITYLNWSERGMMNIWGHLGGAVAGAFYGLLLVRGLEAMIRQKKAEMTSSVRDELERVDGTASTEGEDAP
jgi:rhomboid protease GluP